jgi:hypothetical protein
MANEITFTDITREQFAKYVEIQESGKTNMLDTSAVEWLSDYELDRDTIKCIIHNYDALKGKYHA